MTQTEKQKTVTALREYVERYPSQNKAAASLGVASSTVGAMLKGNHELISEEMWRNIAKRVGATPGSQGWRIVETTAFTEIQAALGDAQAYGNVRWVTGDAGCGKTTAARCYAAEHPEVFTVLCDEDMRKSDFVREIARQVGLKTGGMRLREMLEGTTGYLMQLEAPLLIFDEGDKLNDNVFHYFINIYNRLEGRCGIVFLSTGYIERRLERGVAAGKKGYAEIYSRIGRKYFTLEPTGAADVTAVCNANGLSGAGDVSAVVRESADSDYDLRVVRREIHRRKRMNAARREERGERGEREERLREEREEIAGSGI